MKPKCGLHWYKLVHLSVISHLQRNYSLILEDGESILRVRRNKLVCECSCFNRLAICEHLMAVIKVRGQAIYNSVIKAFVAPTVTSSREVKGSGKKPGAVDRHGG